jgi:RNA polymerase sigma-70 factor (ECF subfamily)
MADYHSYKTQHLVSLAKQGDESALDQLCKAYGERVRRIIRLHMGKELRSKLESMDLVQDAFISALRGLEGFTYKSEGDFLRWISKIAENRIRDNLDKLHADKRDIRKEIPLKDNERPSQDSFIRDFAPADSTTPSMIISKREELDKLEKAMDKLKPEYKEVITLTKIEGLSYEEVGNRLSKSSDAVRMLLARAIAALTSVFEEV